MKTSKNLLTKRRLRAPFVITVAGGVAFGTAGCGTTGEPAEGDDCARVSCNPPPAECPAEAPADRDPCNEAAGSCSYGDCLGQPTIQARCTGGVWRVSETSCNPPAPVCPAEPPAQGDRCTPADPSVCKYGDCAGSPTTTAACKDGAWNLTQISCNPPPPK